MSFRQVTYAKTHSNIFIPGIGDLTQTLPPSNKYIELKMFQTPEGLLLNAAHKGVKAEVFVPNSNVQLAVLAPEDKS